MYDPDELERDRRLWASHNRWRWLQRLGLWIALFAPLWLIAAPDHCRYWAAGGTWLAAGGLAGLAHIMRRRAVVRLLADEDPKP